MSPGPPVYFLHLSKTAGSTLTDDLVARFAPQDVCPARQWGRLLRLGAPAVTDYRCFAGHFGSALIARLDPATVVITMVRDPIARARSHFRHIVRTPGHPHFDLVTREVPTFSELIRHPVACRLALDFQARLLAVEELPDTVTGLGPAAWRDPLDPAHAAFETAEDPFDVDVDERRARALSRLERCVFVGVAERFEESALLLAHTMGWAPQSSGVHLHRAPVTREDDWPVAEADRELLLEHNQADLAVVEWAEATLQRRWLAMLDSLLWDRAERAMAGRAVPLAGTRTFGFDEAIQGSGWRFHQAHPAGGVAWTGPGPSAFLDLPVVTPPGAYVEVLMVAAADSRTADRLALEVNGAPVALTPAPVDGGLVYRGLVAAPPDAAFTRVRVHAPDTGPWQPEHAARGEEVQVGAAIRVGAPHRTGRRARPVMTDPDRPDPVYFLHLPKAAGSTLRTYLESQFRRDEVCPTKLWYELLALPDEARARDRLFSGHFGWCLHELVGAPLTTITMVRDPVERAWSHYRFVARVPEHPQHQLARATGDIRSVPRPGTSASTIRPPPTGSRTQVSTKADSVCARRRPATPMGRARAPEPLPIRPAAPTRHPCAGRRTPRRRAPGCSGASPDRRAAPPGVPMTCSRRRRRPTARSAGRRGDGRAGPAPTAGHGASTRGATRRSRPSR